jgi:hypothetical protein
MRPLARPSGHAPVAPMRWSKHCNAANPQHIKRLQKILTEQSDPDHHPMKRRLVELKAVEANRDTPSSHRAESDA